jgi:hypothetical protein
MKIEDKPIGFLTAKECKCGEVYRATTNGLLYYKTSLGFVVLDSGLAAADSREALIWSPVKCKLVVTG